MNNPNNINQLFFQTEFDSVVSVLENDYTVLVKYNGELNPENISKLESEIENKLIEASVPKSPHKKIFFISVETLQNMLIHGHKNDNGEQNNFFVLSKKDNTVEITSANLISNYAIGEIQNQIDKINSFDDAPSLKQYYMEHLENNQLSEKGGAGLGFITIAMKSGNKLKYTFKEIDEKYSLFLMSSNVNLD